MTIDELNAAKDVLQKAIYSGAMEVRFGERWIRYQSTTDMRQALADLNSQIDAASASPLSPPRSMCNFTQFNG